MSNYLTCQTWQRRQNETTSIAASRLPLPCHGVPCLAQHRLTGPHLAPPRHVLSCDMSIITCLWEALHLLIQIAYHFRKASALRLRVALDESKLLLRGYNLLLAVRCLCEFAFYNSHRPLSKMKNEEGATIQNTHPHHYRYSHGLARTLRASCLVVACREFYYPCLHTNKVMILPTVQQHFSPFHYRQKAYCLLRFVQSIHDLSIAIHEWFRSNTHRKYLGAMKNAGKSYRHTIDPKSRFSTALDRWRQKPPSQDRSTDRQPSRGVCHGSS
jgi:hypothetical protein